MFGTSFIPIDNAIELGQPILSPFSLGLITAIATFIILGCTLLSLIPATDAAKANIAEELHDPEENAVTTVNSPDSSVDESAQIAGKIPIQKNQKTYFVDMSDVVSISADGHYTNVRSVDGEACFCNYSLSRVEKELDPLVFLRVHRSHIVNISHIESFERRHDKGLLTVPGFDTPIPVSRSNINKIQIALGL